jgi:hypothetical protein
MRVDIPLIRQLFLAYAPHSAIVELGFDQNLLA